AIGPAPSTAASMMSRAKPVRRDSNVRPPTVKMRPITARARPFEKSSCRRKRASGKPGAVQNHAVASSKPAGPLPARAWLAHDEDERAVRKPSAAQRAAYRGDDPARGRLVEIGWHGQADHLLGEPFAHRRAALDDR